VPNPNDDGVWFYIDFHDPHSTRQIHTQPMIAKYCLGDQRLSFLILEGKKSKPVGGNIWQILQQHGVEPCSEAKS
jgi:hypothetical protein